MSKFFLFSKFNTNKTAKNPGSSWQKKFNFNYFNFSIIGFGLVLVLFVSYIILVNDTANDGFALDDLEKHLTQLEKQNELLELKVQNSQSMVYLKTMADEKEFLITVEDPQYLSGPSAVALSE